MGFLSGVGDFLFGESPDVQHDQLSTLTPEQREFLNRLLPLIEGRVNQPINPDQLELTSLAGLENLVNQTLGASGGPLSQAAQGTAAGGLSALDEIFASSAADIDEFFNAAVQDPLLESFGEDVLPAIHTRFAPQFFGGERRESEARAREDLVDTLARERSKFAFSARESGQDRKLKASAVAPSTTTSAATLPFAELNAQLPVLETGRAGGAASSQRLLDEMNRRIREALASIGLPAFENVSTVDPGSAGLIPSAIGGLAGNAGFGSALGGAIFSSEEWKEDIGEPEAILDALDNLDIKSWRYKEETGLGTEKHIGPMAEAFNEVFGLGDGKVIPVVDAIGVTMQSVKDLSNRVKAIQEVLS